MLPTQRLNLIVLPSVSGGFDDKLLMNRGRNDTVRPQILGWKRG